MRTPALYSFALLAAAALFACAPHANAQVVYGFSSLSINASTVTSYSETDLDSTAEAYYDVETDAYLWAGNSVADSNSSGGSVTLSVATSLSTDYEIQTNHWVIPSEETPYCFYCVAAGGWYEGSMSLEAILYNDDSDYEAVYVGTTYETGNTNGSPPSISSVDYTTYGNELRGTSGYVILYGSNFTTPYGDTNVNFGFGYATYVSESQINLYYSIPVDTASGTYSNNIDVSTPYSPDAYADFYVYDPTPVITSISPSSWQAGSSTSVTISGSGFGSYPSVSFSDSYINFSPSSAGDTWITGLLTVASADPGEAVTVTVAADAWGAADFRRARAEGRATPRLLRACFG